MISDTSGNLVRANEFNSKWDSLGLVVGVEADEITKLDIQNATSKFSKRTILRLCQKGVDRDGTPFIDVPVFTSICRAKAEEYLTIAEATLPKEYKTVDIKVPEKAPSPPKKSPLKVNTAATTPSKLSPSPKKQETPTSTSHVSESYVSRSPYDEEIEFDADDDEDADTYQNKVFLNHTSSFRQSISKESPLKSPKSNNSFSFNSKGSRNSSFDRQSNSGNQQLKMAATEWVFEQMKEHFDADAVEKLRRTVTSYSNERRLPPKPVSFKSMTEMQIVELQDIVEDILRTLVKKSDELRRVQVAFMFVEPSDEVLMGVRNSKIETTAKKWLTIRDVQQGFLAGRLRLTQVQAYAVMKLVSQFAKETQASGFVLDKEEVKQYLKGKQTGNMSRIALAKGQKLNGEWLRKYLIHLKITKRTKPTRFFLGSAQPEPKITTEEDNHDWDIYLKASKSETSKKTKPVIYNHVALTDETITTKAMKSIPTSFLTLVKGKPHSFTNDDINNILNRYNILAPSFIRQEIFRRVDAWVIDYDGRKSFQHGMNVEYSKWLKTHSAPASFKEKETVFESLKKDLIILKTEELISSERVNKAITKDLFWKYDKYMKLLNYSKNISWNTWLDNHSTKMEELLLKSRGLSKNLKFDASKLVAAGSSPSGKGRPGSAPASRSATPLKSNLRRSTSAIPKVVNDLVADSALMKKSLSALEKAALEASNLGTSSEDFDKHLRGVLIPHLKQLEAEVRRDNELFTSRSMLAISRNSDEEGKILIGKDKLSFEAWKRAKDEMRKEIISKQLRASIDKEQEVEKKKLLGHQKYDEWLQLQKRGQYLSNTKGATTIPKHLVTMHDSEFDTVRKNKKVQKNSEDLDIDLTIEGTKLNSNLV